MRFTYIRNRHFFSLLCSAYLVLNSLHPMARFSKYKGHVPEHFRSGKHLEQCKKCYKSISFIHYRKEAAALIALLCGFLYSSPKASTIPIATIRASTSSRYLAFASASRNSSSSMSPGSFFRSSGGRNLRISNSPNSKRLSFTSPSLASKASLNLYCQITPARLKASGRFRLSVQGILQSFSPILPSAPE